MRRRTKQFAIFSTAAILILLIGAIHPGIRRLYGLSGRHLQEGANLSLDDEPNRLSGKSGTKSTNGNPKADPSYVPNQLIASPVSALGVNPDAKSYYKLSDDQALAISASLRDSRLSIAQTLIERMEEQSAHPDAARTIIYHPDPEIAEQFKKSLHDSLTQIAGSEFANSGVSVLYNDFRFLGGGLRGLRIDVNPGDDSDESTVKSVRLTTMTADSSPATVWTGSPEALKDAYWIELDL